jgi:hypothetical protein
MARDLAIDIPQQVDKRVFLKIGKMLLLLSRDQVTGGSQCLVLPRSSASREY